MSQPRPEGIILELIERTKQAVRALDNMNYRKMKKMIMGDPSGEVSEEGDTSIADTEDDDDKSMAVSCFFLLLFYFRIYMRVFLFMFTLAWNTVSLVKYAHWWTLDKGEANRKI